MSTSRPKISLQLHETVEAEENYQENWTKLKTDRLFWVKS